MLTSLMRSDHPLYRAARFVAVPALLILASGCTTYYGSATFQSDPPGVSVHDLEDGTVIGVTPVKYVWRSKDSRRKYMNIRLHKDGYVDAVKSFWLALDYNSAEDAAQNPQQVTFDLNKQSQ